MTNKPKKTKTSSNLHIPSNIFLINVLKSKYCKITFLISLIISYFLIPNKIFYKGYIILAIIFMFLFALTITCIIRTLKERIISAKKSGATILSIIGTILGIGALQTCTIGAPICGASVGLGIVSIFFPHTAHSLMHKYSIYIIYISIVFQIIALYFMNCFKKTK